MEGQENIPSPHLFPQVSKETIDEMGDVQTKAEELFQSLAVTDENSDTEFLNFEEGFPFYLKSGGGLTVFSLLTKEAKKQGKRLPNIHSEDMENYRKNHPYADFYNILMNFIDKISETGLTRKSTQEVGGNIQPSFDKFRPENPDLMDYLERLADKTMELAISSKSHSAAARITQWKLSSLCTYDLLRFKAERNI